MKNATDIDVPRMIRVITFLVAAACGALVHIHYQARVATIEYRIADAEATLRSEEVAASEMVHLRKERRLLAARYARLLTQNAEAVFLSEMMSAARSQGVDLISTSLARETSSLIRHSGTGFFSQTRVTLELRGPYRNLLVAISRLSAGSEIVAVERPSLRRDGALVTASIPITIYEPTFAIVPTP